jgi:hypothetical protein
MVEGKGQTRNWLLIASLSALKMQFVFINL